MQGELLLQGGDSLKDLKKSTDARRKELAEAWGKAEYERVLKQQEEEKRQKEEEEREAKKRKS